MELRSVDPLETSSGIDIGVYGGRGIPSTYSGYETFLTALLPELVRRGHRVTMYVRPGEHGDGGTYRGVERVVLPSIEGKSLSTLSHGFVSALVARRARHDVLLVVNVANAPYCGIARWTGQPVALNVDGQEWLRGKWSSAGKAFFKGSARIARYTANSLVADCQAMADIYRQQFRSETTVIPYCFPLSQFTFDPAVPRRFGSEPGDYFIIAGRLNPENNIDAVAERYAASDRPEPLLVLGVANYDSPVQRRLDDLAARDRRIRLLGHVESREEFLSLLRGAACYVHGHSVGGMNPSLVEAMGSGALVAALDTPFNRETLGGLGAYFASDLSDLPAVLDAVVSRSDEAQERERAAVRDRVVTSFNLEVVADAYEGLLRSLAGQKRRALVEHTQWATA